jgi:DNA-binding transcriptional LysR family regulator
MMQTTMQYRLDAADLRLILALSRAGKLAGAGERLGVDSSTVFRSLQRIERGLGVVLFERSRRGYSPNELAQALAEQGERLEAVLEAASSALQTEPAQVAGTVRLTTTDTVLHGLIAPALGPLKQLHPLLSFDISTGNELANLTRRDADIAVRATKRPPQHLVGKCIGPVRVALYAGAGSGVTLADVEAERVAWVAPDEALPEHPSVQWRRKRFPKVAPLYKVSSILSVADLVGQHLGVGLLPVFLAERQPRLLRLTDEIAECQTELWLLTHAEARHQRRVAAVYSYLAQHVVLP